MRNTAETRPVEELSLPKSHEGSGSLSCSRGSSGGGLSCCLRAQPVYHATKHGRSALCECPFLYIHSSYVSMIYKPANLKLTSYGVNSSASILMRRCEEACGTCSFQASEGRSGPRRTCQKRQTPASVASKAPVAPRSSLSPAHPWPAMLPPPPQLRQQLIHGFFACN